MNRLMYFTVCVLLSGTGNAAAWEPTLDKSWPNDGRAKEALTQVINAKEPATAGSFAVEMRGFEPLTS